MPFDMSRFFSLPLCSFQQSCIACVGKMKRTAMDAQLPEEPSRIRLDITMPQEQWGHRMTFQVLCKSDETVDDAKRRLHSIISKPVAGALKSPASDFCRTVNTFPTRDRSLTSIHFFQSSVYGVLDRCSAEKASLPSSARAQDQGLNLRAKCKAGILGRQPS